MNRAGLTLSSKGLLSHCPGGQGASLFCYRNRVCFGLNLLFLAFHFLDFINFGATFPKFNIAIFRFGHYLICMIISPPVIRGKGYQFPVMGVRFVKIRRARAITPFYIDSLNACFAAAFSLPIFGS